MAKVYLVTQGCYSDYGIERAFSTRELAQAFIGEQEKPDSEWAPQIEEWELDEAANDCHQKVWSARIWFNSTPPDYFGGTRIAGNIESSGRASDKILPRGQRYTKVTLNQGDIQEKIGVKPARYGNYMDAVFKTIAIAYWANTESNVSQEHANKLAVEARQEWLRTHPETEEAQVDKLIERKRA
jgi:hypothetical protein